MGGRGKRRKNFSLATREAGAEAWKWRSGDNTINYSTRWYLKHSPALPRSPSLLLSSNPYLPVSPPLRLLLFLHISHCLRDQLLFASLAPTSPKTRRLRQTLKQTCYTVT